MKNVNKQTSTKGALASKQRSYNEIIEFLDNNWKTNKEDKDAVCCKSCMRILYVDDSQL